MDSARTELRSAPWPVRAPFAGCPSRSVALAARIAGIDAVKVLAILHVVAFHMAGEALRTDPRAVTGHVRAALDAFIILSLAVVVARGAPGSLGSYAARRTRRILGPWVCWSVLYGVVLAATRVAAGRPALGFLHLSMLLHGTSAHLWFLPFIFLANLAVSPVARATRGVPLGVLAPLLVATGAFAAWLARLGALSFGVYLVHPLVVSQVYWRLPHDGEVWLYLPLVAVLSGWIVHWLGRTRLRSVL